MHLSAGDFGRFLAAIPDLYAYRPFEEFLEHSLRVIRLLVVCDHIGWLRFAFDDAPKLISVVESEKRVTPKIVSLLEDSVISHPFSGHWAGAQGQAALMFSDFPTQVMLTHRGQYEELYRSIEMNYGMSIPIDFDHRGGTCLSFIKRSRDFTEQDRLMSTLLRPHLQRAYANAQLVTQNLCKPCLQRSITLQDLGLTIKESAVAFWLAEGKTNREIGLILGTAARTVEKHVEKILRKLRVENRTAAAIEIGRIVH